MWARKISLPKVSVCNFILRPLCLRTDLLRICALSYLFLPTFALAALSLFFCFPSVSTSRYFPLCCCYKKPDGIPTSATGNQDEEDGDDVGGGNEEDEEDSRDEGSDDDVGGGDEDEGAIRPPTLQNMRVGI